MPLDLTPDLCKALKDPEVISALAQHLKPVLLQAFIESAADGWLGWKPAAAYVYGRDDRHLGRSCISHGLAHHFDSHVLLVHLVILLSG